MTDWQKELDRWIDEERRRWAERAWDQGWAAGNEYAISEPWDTRMQRSANPYRQAPIHSGEETS